MCVYLLNTNIGIIVQIKPNNAKLDAVNSLLCSGFYYYISIIKQTRV